MPKILTLSYRTKPSLDKIKEAGGLINYKSNYTNTIIASFLDFPHVLTFDPNLICIELDDDIAPLSYRTDQIATLNPHDRKKRFITKQIYPWNIKRVLAGKRLSTGNGVKVGIIDTGIQLDHPDLADNIKGGINILDPKKKPYDDNGHGTHIAGIIAASNNKIGVVGIACSASVYPIKVLDRHGAGSLSNLIKGIEWAIAKKMHIINISISGGQLSSPSLNAVIKVASQKGIIIIAAAGNTGASSKDTVQIPARIKPVIAVAALNNANVRDHYSAVGSTVDIAAPGTKILSTYPNNAYAYLSGTSMAAAHVTGVMAIYRKLYPEETRQTLYNFMKQRAVSIGSQGNPYTGWGLVRVK